MKKILMVLVAGVAVAMTGSAMAAPPADTTVGVTAKVVGTCQFNTTGSIDFGTLDQTSTSDASPVTSTAAKFWCTKNHAYALSAVSLNGGGTVYKMVSGADTIDYAFALTNATGQGQGKTTPINIGITASIPNANFINAPAGSYSDTVTITFTP